MTEGGTDAARRRRRRRATSAQGPAPAPASSLPDEPIAPPAVVVAPPRTAARPAKKQRAPRDHGDRTLHDLVGSGPSQLGVSGALRARDVDRPTAADLATAERDTVIVRRNWQPGTDPPPNRRRT